MYQQKCRNTAVTLFSSDGQVYVYASMKEALSELGFSFIRRSVSAQFERYCWHYAKTSGEYCRSLRRNLYVMRNDWGEPLMAEDFVHLVQVRQVYRKLWFGGRTAGGHHFRRPKTQNERRMNDAVVEEGEPVPRAARRGQSIPSDRHDYAIAARKDRGWKRHRRTQWRDKD
ncbi:MAG TPA: hypothetical protein VLC92_16120 [Rhodocyclaceae bacterium]|nr:hypothetical protein [Rhodocyclaceae bacterium]